MPLPTAVARNAEKARQKIAAQSGSTQRAPLQSGDEYLKPIDVTPQPSAKTTDDATQASKDQREGQYVPHSLSDDAVTRPLSEQSDSAGGTQDKQRSQPDFIDPENWKARYAVLRTSRDERSISLDAEVSELRAQNRSLQAKLEKATQADQVAQRKQFDEQATEAFGEDGAKLFNQINNRIDDRMEAQQQSTMGAFESNMDSLVPRWRMINTEPAFLEYLRGIDDVLGISRQAMLDSIVNDRDANAAAAMFRNYVAMGNGQTQQRNGLQVPEFDSQRSGTALGAEEQLVEEWSESEIADFYQRKNRLYQAGKLRGAMLEKVQADEARIRNAMAEGRVYKG